MKKLITMLFVSVLTVSQAQVKTPQASVPSTQETTVGLTKIEIQYSRPSKKGRVIFGDLVPYGKIWRTGANANTTISFSDDVEIGGKTLKAGKYGLFTKPGKDTWEIYFYSENNNWGNAVKWDDAKVVAKATEKVQHIPGLNTETFLISIGDLSNTTAMLNFLWDDVLVQTKIKVPTDSKVMASIEETMKGKPSAKDLIAAANYYYSTGKDIQQAKKWMDEGMKQLEKPAYFQTYLQALITEKSGDKKAAISLAKKAQEAAKADGNEEYVKNAETKIKEWSK